MRYFQNKYLYNIMKFPYLFIKLCIYINIVYFKNMQIILHFIYNYFGIFNNQLFLRELS